MLENTETQAQEDAAPEEVLDTPESFDNSEEAEAPGEVESGTGKFRIGSKSFDTAEAAYAYAQSHINELETTVQVTDAYRQGMRDAMNQPNPQASVTPEPEEADDFNEEEYYANPKGFLKKFEEKIEKRVFGTIQKTQSQKEQSDAIWREFGDRHPVYADNDFRSDIEGIAAEHATTLRSIIATKGRDAAYDFCALKMREKVDKYAQAAKPKRQLANTNQGATPTTSQRKQSGVTPNKSAEKPLSFVDQIKKIKGKR